MNNYLTRILFALALFIGSNTYAGEADVEDATVRCNAVSCTFNVTVKHSDQGWKHYADKWDILTPDGEIIATRTLHHPHVKEQPFTRSLGNVTVPEKIKTVIVRAHDSVHGYGGKELTVDIVREK